MVKKIWIINKEPRRGQNIRGMKHLMRTVMETYVRAVKGRRRQSDRAAIPLKPVVIASFVWVAN